MIKVSAYLDKRTVKSDGTHPVKVLILFPNKIRKGVDRISMTQNEWSKIYGQNLRDQRLIDIKKKISDEQKRAEDIIKDLENANRLTRENFLKYFDFKKNKKDVPKAQTSKKQKKDIYDLLEEKIRTFDDVDSGTGENYGKALKSFKNFKPTLKYSELTPQFFKDYETFMLNNAKSLTLIGIYCRAIRIAIKLAIKQKYMKEDDYPFGKRTDGRYSIPKGNRSKRRALPDDYLKEFVHFVPEKEEEDYAKNIVLFSFYSNGMNMRDVFHLQPDNITDKTISFIRRKTRRMTTESIRIEIPLTLQIKNILEKWGTKNPQKHEYIFPLLNSLFNEDFNNLNPMSRNVIFNKAAYRIIKNEVRKLNRILKNIEKKTKSPIHLSTNIARYTWANFLDRAGAPLKYIQEGLGHTSPTTTLHYLENLREEDKKEYTELLASI